MSNKYYKTKWDGLSFNEKIELSKKEEDKLSSFLIQKCNFNQIIPTRDSIKTQAKEKSIILPDLMGVHKNNKEYFIELKCKNRRMKFKDNGIDLNKAKSYLKAGEVFYKNVLLVFIDDEREWKTEYPFVDSLFKDRFGICTYYGNWIDKLYDQTPKNPITTFWSGGKEIICFPLSNMKDIEEIFKERQTKLSFGVID